MSLSAPRLIFGSHSVTLYNRSTGVPYNQGILRVIKSAQLKAAGDIVELRGGSSRSPWANEDGNINYELTMQASEYPNVLFEVFLGKLPTDVSPEASGNASALTDKYGSSVVDAAGLLSTVTVSAAADLKFGKYIVKATGVAAISVYKSTNIDDARGTDAAEFSDALLVQSFTGVGSGSTHAVTGHGITLTAGASAGGMTSGDTATFYVRPLSTGTSMTVTVGGLTDTYPEFGALLYSQQRGSGEMTEVEVYKVKAIGVDLGSSTKTYSEWSVNGKCSYDSTNLGVFSVRHIIP